MPTRYRPMPGHLPHLGFHPRRAGRRGHQARRLRSALRSPPERAEDPERIAIRQALAFGKAVYDQRRALGPSVADLAGRAELTVDEVECIV
ncbi:MAG TPA: hypothetical protein VFW50_20890, partial [Streptosporangiaceae bacterium]|nr:hypothetical protein [Streptosporangiaceae bacterium]